MIQDIGLSKLHNEYKICEMREEDTAFYFDATGRLMTWEENGTLTFLSKKEIGGQPVIYLFAIDEKRYFLVTEEPADPRDGYTCRSIREVRDFGVTGKDIFAVFTAYHLWRWYADNRYCGRCAEALVPSTQERALCCPKCKNTVYPRINPAVIVGVTNGDKLLLTKYRTGYGHNALVAGFTEIGETLEETVAREVMEETGVKVKNIRYYKSQPWGMAQDILVGYYCDADGDSTIHMDEGELKYAEWVPREEIELQPNNLSLTNEMMRMFKENRI